jgi:hypothetical protein
VPAVALLRRHVAVRPHGHAQLPRLGDRARDAEVDQPRRGAHHDVLGLDVEVDHPLAGQVVQRGGDVQAERQHLLRGQGAVAEDQVAQRRAFEVLDQQMREAAAGHRVEAAHDRGMREPRQRLRLAFQLPQPDGIGCLVGAQDLCDEHGEPMVVPDEEDLVAAPAAEPAEHRAPGRDGVALDEAPGGARAAGLLPGGRLGDGGIAGRRLGQGGEVRCRLHDAPSSSSACAAGPALALVVAAG